MFGRLLIQKCPMENIIWRILLHLCLNTLIQRYYKSTVKSLCRTHRTPLVLISTSLHRNNCVKCFVSSQSQSGNKCFLEKGIMAGCTISVVLFVAAMNLLLKAAGMQCRGPKADDDTRHPSWGAFMDDVTVITPMDTQWILSALEKMANWSRMQFNS